MQGMVTQTRDLNPQRLYQTVYYQGKLQRRVDLTMPNDQTTTSFRSSRGELSHDEQIQNLLAQRRLPKTDLYPTPSDIGHPFSTLKTTSYTSHKKWRFNDVDNGDGAWTEGPLVLCKVIQQEPNYFVPLLPPLTESQISTRGTGIIHAAAPTRPEASLTTFLGELSRDGMPSLIGLSIMRSRAHAFQKLGGEYLNVEFGWKPFISDLRKIATAVVNSHRVFDQYRRDSGRLVRRRLSLPVETVPTYEDTWVTYASGEVFKGLSTYTLSSLSGRSIFQTSTASATYSFAGAFTYYLDVGDSHMSKLSEFEQLANKLLGTRITPAVLWELAPWSWLADWFANIGPILSNASLFSADGLVMKYGYLMRHSVAETSVSLPNVIFRDGARAGTVTNIFRSSRKERVKATPYGFGLDMSALSTRQWAILGALGMSRAPRVAW